MNIRHRFADVEFDEADNQLRVAGKPVVVEPRPLRLLQELLRHVGEIVTKEELLDTVWEGRPTVDHVLANAVSKLRTALGEHGAARLSTVPRVGYRLSGPVQRSIVRAPEVVLQAGQAVPGREGYVLERPLGQGGHSDVWLARHAKLGQSRVFKFASDGVRLAALKREYTLYRVMAHELGRRDDITRVLDTNFTAPPYFIECEYGGQNLVEWSEDGGRLAKMPQEQRIELFLQIARSVAAAHSVGVLHKDLKPGNVLVKAVSSSGLAMDLPASVPQWQAGLTDFGSGRLLNSARLEDLQLTALGLTQSQAARAESNSGTVLYLAPEVVAGEPPTVQSDVYALGLMLWQLLAGDMRRPLASGWQREVDDELLREDVLAATEGRPQDRLKSAAELVDRLASLQVRRQARADEAEHARQSTQARAESQRRHARRPWMLGALASLLASLAASTGFALQARSAQRRSDTEARRASAVNSFMREDFVTGIDVADAGPGGTVSMRVLLDRAATKAGERFRDQPEILALVRGQLAGVYLKLSMYDRAEAEYRSALALAAPEALRSDPDMLGLRFDLIATLAVHNKLPEARTLLPVAEQDAGPLIQGRTAVAQQAAYARLVVLHGAEKFKEALVVGERMMVLADLGANPARPEDWFTVRLALGDTLFRLNELSRAETVLKEALTPTKAGRVAVGAVSQARARVNLGRVYLAQGREPEGEQMLKAARELLASRIGPDEYHVNVADAELAQLWDKRGDFVRSRAAFAAVHQSYLRALGPEHPHTQVMTLNLAIAELNLGRPEVALPRLDAGRSWFVRYAGGEQGAVVQAIDFERARAMTALRRPIEAVPILARLDAQALAAAAPARDWPGRLQAERGRALLASGQRDEGLRLLRAALPDMSANGSAPWVLAGYRALVR
jgi:non-specific serine/threonine protein kinase